MPHRPHRSSAGTALLAAPLLAFLMLGATPARAGFEWVPTDNGAMNNGMMQPSVVVPPQPAPSPQSSVSRGRGGYVPAAASRPVASSPPEIISPVIISGSGSGSGSGGGGGDASAGIGGGNAPMQDNGGEMTVYNGDSDAAPGGPVMLRPSTPATTYGALAARPPAAPAPGTLGTLSTASAAPSANDTVQGFAKNVPLVVALRQILPSGYAFSVDANIDMGTPVSFTGGRPWRDTLQTALQPVGLSMREQGQMVSIGHADDAYSPAPALQPAANRSAPLSSAAARSGLEPQPLHPLPATTVTSTGGDIVTPLSSGMNGVNGMGGGGGGPLPADAEAINGSWSAERGDNLKKVLETWCRRAHVEFDWLAEYDYPLQASVSFSGSFEDAVRQLLAGFEGAHPQPVAELHTNPNMRQTVLIVQTRGNTNSD